MPKLGYLTVVGFSLLFWCAPASAQKTSVTSTNLQTGGSVISVGTIVITPSDASGNAIPFAGGDGSQGVGGFKGSIVNGVIQSVVNGNLQNGLVVPDQAFSVALTPGAPLWYSVQISNTATGAGYKYQLPPNTITGTAFALDQFRPIQVAAALTGTVISVAQPVNLNCAAGSRLIIYSGSAITSIYECVNGHLLLTPSGGVNGTGTPGPPGTTPAITIGTVTTGQPGTQAFVSKDPTSTPTNVVLDFVIPQGSSAQGGSSGGGTSTNSVLFADTSSAGNYYSLTSAQGRLTLSPSSSGTGAVNSISITDPSSSTTRTVTVANGRIIFN